MRSGHGGSAIGSRTTDLDGGYFIVGIRWCLMWRDLMRQRLGEGNIMTWLGLFEEDFSAEII